MNASKIVETSSNEKISSPAIAAPIEPSTKPVLQHAPLPFHVDFGEAVKIKDAHGNSVLTMMQIHLNGRRDSNEVNNTARLIVTAANSHEGLKEALREMRRFIPVIERAEAEPETWERLTAELGIATANAYRAALAAAAGE